MIYTYYHFLLKILYFLGKFSIENYLVQKQFVKLTFLLKLITVQLTGKYDTQQELNELCRIHESLKVKYTSTLFDSRCIMFGLHAVTSYSSESTSGDGTTFCTPSNFKARALFYRDSESCDGIETQVIF